MNAVSLRLNLGDNLSGDELAECIAEADEQDIPLEKVLLNGAREVARRRREQRAVPGNGGSHPEMAA